MGLEEHRLLLGFQQERALGAEDRFAVAAETVAVDRGVLHADLLPAGDRVLGVVAGGGELEDAIDVVLDVAVGREQRPVAGGGHVQRMLLLAVVRGGDEDARRVELMAAQFGHQPAAGAVPQPPADQFLDGRPAVNDLARGVLDLQILVAELLGVDDGVFNLGTDLSHLLFPLGRRLAVVPLELRPAWPTIFRSSSSKLRWPADRRAWRPWASAAASYRCPAGCRGATGRGCECSWPNSPLRIMSTASSYRML